MAQRTCNDIIKHGTHFYRNIIDAEFIIRACNNNNSITRGDDRDKRRTAGTAYIMWVIITHIFDLIFSTPQRRTRRRRHRRKKRYVPPIIILYGRTVATAMMIIIILKKIQSCGTYIWTNRIWCASTRFRHAYRGCTPPVYAYLGYLTDKIYFIGWTHIVIHIYNIIYIVCSDF